MSISSDPKRSTRKRSKSAPLGLIPFSGGLMPNSFIDRVYTSFRIFSPDSHSSEYLLPNQLCCNRVFCTALDNFESVQDNRRAHFCHSGSRLHCWADVIDARLRIQQSVGSSCDGRRFALRRNPVHDDHKHRTRTCSGNCHWSCDVDIDQFDSLRCVGSGRHFDSSCRAPQATSQPDLT